MRFTTRLLAAVGLSLFPLLSTPAEAQSLQVRYNSFDSTFIVRANRSDVTDVVRQLFTQVGSPRYEIDRDVRGEVTLDLNGASRDAALRSVLQQVGAIYTVQNGVYVIRPGRPGSSAAERRMDVQFNALSLREAAQLIGEKYGRKLRTEGNLPGRVSLNLRGATFDQAVRALLDANRMNAAMEARTQGDWVVIIPIDSLPKPGDMPEEFRKLVSLSAQDRPIAEVTRALTNQTGIDVRYDRDIPGDLRVRLIARNEPFWTVLQRLAIAAELKTDITGPKQVTLRPLSSVYVNRRGERIGSVVEEYGNCRSCRYELKRGWRYCPMCGEKVGR